MILFFFVFFFTFAHKSSKVEDFFEKYFVLTLILELRNNILMHFDLNYQSD